MPNGGSVFTGPGGPVDHFVGMHPYRELVDPIVAIETYLAGLTAVPPGTPLGTLSYEGASDTNYSITTTSMAAVDTTNLRLPVTIPASGKILVRWSAFAGVATGAANCYAGVMNGATVLVKGLYVEAITSLQRTPFEAYITGLTPGAMNLDLAAYTSNGADALLLYYGPNYGPITFVAEAR